MMVAVWEVWTADGLLLRKLWEPGFVHGVVVADGVPPRRFWDPGLLIPGLVLVGVVLVGALVVYAVKQWRTRPARPTLTANDQLANFRELYERGELSQGEFERIKARLAPLARQEMEAAQAQAANPTPASAADSAARRDSAQDEKSAQADRSPPGPG